MKGTWSQLRVHAIAIALFLACVVIYRAAPIMYWGDSDFSLVLSDSLLRHQSFSLERYNIPDPLHYKPAPGREHETLYQIEMVGGKPHYYFPPGTSILSLPYVAILKVLGVEFIHADGTVARFPERYLGRRLGIILSATVAVIIFYIALRFAAPLPALAIAIAFALGSPLLSTTSRGLWAHDWGITLLAGIVLCLLRTDWLRHAAIPLAVGVATGFLYWIRPTFAVTIVAVTGWVWFAHRDYFWRYALGAGGTLALLVAYSMLIYGTPLPPYYSASRLSFGTAWLEGLAGTLLSPGRGLLVYCPFLIIVIAVLLRYRSHLHPHAAAIAALSAIAFHWIAISAFPVWPAGHSFGPRYFTDVIPWFALLTACAWQARQRARATLAGATTKGSHALLATTTIAVLFSIFIHTRGAVSPATASWNHYEQGQWPDYLWDWRYPQFLAGLVPRPPVSTKATDR